MPYSHRQCNGIQNYSLDSILRRYIIIMMIISIIFSMVIFTITANHIKWKSLDLCDHTTRIFAEFINHSLKLSFRFWLRFHCDLLIALPPIVWIIGRMRQRLDVHFAVKRRRLRIFVFYRKRWIEWRPFNSEIMTGFTMSWG